MNEENWTYGNWSKYGWGGLKTSYTANSYQDLDFDPEIQYRIDVKNFIKNRKNILALPEMTYFKYLKLLFNGLKRYHKMGDY
jgi:hypothetical protein